MKSGLHTYNQEAEELDADDVVYDDEILNEDEQPEQ